MTERMYASCLACMWRGVVAANGANQTGQAPPALAGDQSRKEQAAEDSRTRALTAGDKTGPYA